MGKGYSLNCRKCGYEFSANLGAGFMFPGVYRQTMEDGREGRLGKEVRQFLEEHPDGALDCGTVILQCAACGELESAPDLSMYVPGEDSPPPSSARWSVAFPYEGVSCVAPWNLDRYRLVRHYDHRCGRCGGKMKVINEEGFERYLRNDARKEPTDLRCPDCGEPLYMGDVWMWD